MARQSKKDREAWTAFIEGRKESVNKYGNDRTKEFDSSYEAKVAADLDALYRCGKIKNLRFQVPYTLVEGRGKIRPIKYIADFVWEELDGTIIIGDAKGCKTQMYRMKRKMMMLLLGIEIKEL
jgi:Protein of unknown function (DUF1064)